MKPNQFKLYYSLAKTRNKFAIFHNNMDLTVAKYTGWPKKLATRWWLDDKHNFPYSLEEN